MTLSAFLNSGIELQGEKKIQCWENDNDPTIYYEGTGMDIPEEYMDREITYIFPYMIRCGSPYNTSAICIAGICIELAEEEIY